jgi:Domain of unknown function (DUF3943)
MPPPRAGALRHALVTGALLGTLLSPGLGSAEDTPPAPRSPANVLDWETGAGKSYLIPALEVPGFVFGLNQLDRNIYGGTDYDTDADSIWKNLQTAPVYDKDPFSVNQLAHPYQGSLYYGFARSTGHSFWGAMGYSLFGSFLWETAGETTPPSINDYVTTTIGGSFVGEAMFRMASLLLEGGGETPGFWRELGAAVLSPPTGLNRLVFGDRFKPVFPSRDPAVFVRLRLGATLTTHVSNANLSSDVRRQEGSGDFYLTYGLPGKPGYQYTRPFDFFLFEFTAVPNANSVPNAIENVTIRGLLRGAKYEAGDDYRGVWGLFGGYEYLSPQIFRVATTNLALGTVFQWWLTRSLALQGTALGGAGFGAAGTVGDVDERDYRYGAIPESLVNLRLIVGDRAMLEASTRQYWIVGLGAGASEGAERYGHELINRLNASLTVRIYGPHALSIGYVLSTRDARVPDGGDRHQSVQTVTLSYNFLGHTRFGAVEWRPAEMASR